jgi:hypothetical protein
MGNSPWAGGEFPLVHGQASMTVELSPCNSNLIYDKNEEQVFYFGF